MGQAYGIHRNRTRNIIKARKSQDENMDTGVASENSKKEPGCTRARCKNCCKSFTAFLFSTVGLVLMVAAYSIAGGFLFQMIEEPEERSRIKMGRVSVDNSTKAHVEKLWEITDRLNILYPQNWTAEAEVVFIEYQKMLYNATTRNHWDGKASGSKVITKWNFAGALLYAVTAITTIGYGHVTPKTGWGMACTILYCLFGLPLTLMCIANLGKLFARVFRVIYHTCCCGICCICCLSYRKKRITRKLTTRINKNGESCDLESLGNGQSLVITNDPNSKDKILKRKPSSSVSISKAQVWMMNVKKKFSHSMRDDVTVPVYLCLVVMAAYIMGGALIFALWDGWGYLPGAYFCFVTLTTIGFGDYVPGVVGGEEEEEVGTERLVLCSLYVFLGLALVGMCIDLMQADVLQKVWWIATKIGIIDKNNENIEATEKTMSGKGSAKSRKDIYSGADISGLKEIPETASPSRKPLLCDSGDRVSKSTFVEIEAENLEKTNKKNRKEKKLKKKMDKHNREPTSSQMASSGSARFVDNSALDSGDKLTNGTHHHHGNEHVAVAATADDNKNLETSNIEHTSKLPDQFLCLPPPDYAETLHDAQAKVSSPATPASYYDDLPSHISNITPEHQRLQDVLVHQHPQTSPDVELPANRNNNRSEIQEDDPLSFNVEPSFKICDEGEVKMIMEEDTQGELLLTVSKNLK